MKCFAFDLNHILKISMLNQEHLIPPRLHCSRWVSEYILYIVTEGHLELLMNDEPLVLTAGDVYLFDKNCYQKPSQATECTFYYVHFETDACVEIDMSEAKYENEIQKKRAEFLNTSIYGIQGYDHMRIFLKQKLHIKKSFMEYIVGILERHKVTYADHTMKRRMDISNAVAGVFTRLEDYAVNERRRCGRQGGVYSTINRIVDYIGANYLKNFESQDIEKDLLINFDYANRIFKKQLGCSIIKYRNILRINTAKSMILATDKTFGEIAEETGFRDRYYFSRYFKNIEGISPSEYRQQVLKEQVRQETQS